MNIDGFEQYDSITEDFCQNYKVAFNDYDDHTIKGGLKVMGESLARGHVLVMSLWDDHEANMLWLDSNSRTAAPPISAPNASTARWPTSLTAASEDKKAPLPKEDTPEPEMSPRIHRVKQVGRADNIAMCTFR